MTCSFEVWNSYTAIRKQRSITEDAKAYFGRREVVMVAVDATKDEKSNKEL